MVDVYTTEPERQAALAEVTRLRREFDTTTAKGAKAFAASPEAQAALARLDAAKSAAGMRTAAEDLAALNAMTGKGKTEALNAPSREYFSQVSAALKDPSKIPTWQGQTQWGKTLTPQDIEYAKTYDIDLSNARFDWVWTDDGVWKKSIIGAKRIPKDESQYFDKAEYVSDLFAGDRITLGEWARRGGEETLGKMGSTWGAFTKGEPTKKERFLLQQAEYEHYKRFNPFGEVFDTEQVAELVNLFPELKYSELQEVIYRLTLERDTDITALDIIEKHNELYGEG